MSEVVDAHGLAAVRVQVRRLRRCLHRTQDVPARLRLPPRRREHQRVGVDEAKVPGRLPGAVLPELAGEGGEERDRCGARGRLGGNPTPVRAELPRDGQRFRGEVEVTPEQAERLADPEAAEGARAGDGAERVGHLGEETVEFVGGQVARLTLPRSPWAVVAVEVTHRVPLGQSLPDGEPEQAREDVDGGG